MTRRYRISVLLQTKTTPMGNEWNSPMTMGKETTRCWGPFECMQHGTVPEMGPVTQAGSWTSPRPRTDIKSHRSPSVERSLIFGKRRSPSRTVPPPLLIGVACKTGYSAINISSCILSRLEGAVGLNCRI